MSFLDDLPLASIVFVVSVVLIVIAYVTNDISIQDSFTYLAFAGGGTGAIGYARAQSGKGTK